MSEEVRMTMDPARPFKLPENDNIFLLRTKQKEQEREEMLRYLALPVHEKTTFSGRLRAKRRELRTQLKKELEEEGEDDRGAQGKPLRGRTSRPHMSSIRLAVLRGDNVEKESIQDFITNKRERFLLEYSLMVKTAEMKKLDNTIADEQRRLRKAERLLQEDALLFEEFLQENNKNAAAAIALAEQETRSKMEKIAEINKLTAEVVTLKSKISRNEEILQEYNTYKDFLFKVSPPEWQQTQRRREVSITKQDKETRTAGKERSGAELQTSSATLPPIKDIREHSRRSTTSSIQGNKSLPVAKPDSDSSEYEDDPELYFSEPQQLLDVLAALEEQNLFLVQNCRETEEDLEELRRTLETSRSSKLLDEEQLTKQIDATNQAVAKEKEKAAQLKLKAHLFNFGKLKPADQDGLLDALGGKVEEVYRRCVGEKAATLSTVQMLAAIEAHVYQLLESLQKIPPATLERVLKLKDRERRMRQREEEAQEKRRQQEERLRKSLERAQADVKKASGKKLMPRSKPVVRKPTSQKTSNTSEAEELHAYYFT